MRGHWIKLSIPRRIVIDFMYLAAGLPSIAAQRRLILRGVVEAREASHPDRPTWTAVFAKAFALVAVEIPELRRVYVRCLGHTSMKPNSPVQATTPRTASSYLTLKLNSGTIAPRFEELKRCV